jgi:large subunit ribosomal protein L10
MSKNFEIKKTVVAEIKEKLERAQSIVLIDYRGLTVAEVTDLRNQFRGAGVEYAVLKNTMITLAAQDLQITGLEEHLKGPTAVAFGYNDPVAPAKIITEYVKKNKKISVKCGMIDKKVVDVAGVTALAELPPREVLIAKMMGSMNAPITGFVGVLSGVMRKFVYAVEAVRKQKAGEE